MLPSQFRKEQISFAYVQAIAAKAGFKCTKKDVDCGIDMTIDYVQETISGKFRDTGEVLNLQIKSTANIIVDGEYIVYDLEIDNYNDLIRTDIGNPLILVLYCMPTDENSWVCVSTEETTLKHCAYWCSLRGLPYSENDRTKRIRISENQIFDDGALKEIMEKIREDEFI